MDHSQKESTMLTLIFFDSIMGTKQSRGIIIKQNKNKHKTGVAKVLKTTEPGSRDMDKTCVEYI